MKDRIVYIADKTIEFSLYIMLISIPFSKAAIESCFGVILLGFIIKKWLKPDFEFFKSPPYYFLASFILFCVLSMVNSGPYLQKSLSAFVFKWLENIMIFIIIQDCIALDHRRLRNMLAVLIAASVLMGLDGIYQQFARVDFLRHRDIPLKAPITATFKNQNSFAGYLLPLLLLVIPLISLKNTKKSHKVLLALLSILLAACLVLTFSRGAWLGFFIAIIVMIILAPQRKLLLFIFGIFFAALIIIPGSRSDIIAIFQSRGYADRFTLWRTAWHIILENPFLGKGLGTYMDYFSKYDYVPDKLIYYAHNCFLQIWAETGIFALLSFMGFLGAILLKGATAFKKNHDFITLGLLCALVGLTVHSMFDVHLYSLQLSVIFWSIAGILYARSQQHP